MSGNSKPGAWVTDVGHVAPYVAPGTRYQPITLGPEAVCQGINGRPGAVIVVRWADGTTPAAPSGQAMEGRCSSCGTPLYMRGRGGCDECKALTAPSGHNGTDYQWVCVESCTADDPHGEHCDWQTPAPSPDTVTVPKAEWDALVEAFAERDAAGAGPAWQLANDRCDIAAEALVRAAGSVR